mmetsp:Transcript_40352/g.96843  ORF Transcript_40352/g.96843 Transcript_40352/m.96843 type:complete len:279 (-) Transcript_40352:31-867(-)
MQAVYSDNPRLVDMALDNGADVDACTDAQFQEMFLNESEWWSFDVGVAPDTDGITPLMKACEFGHREVAQRLLERNANVNAVDHDGWNALFFAAKGGHVELCQWLVSRGVKTTLRDRPRGHAFLEYCQDTTAATQLRVWMEARKIPYGKLERGRVGTGAPSVRPTGGAAGAGRSFGPIGPMAGSGLAVEAVAPPREMPDAPELKESPPPSEGDDDGFYDDADAVDVGSMQQPPAPEVVEDPPGVAEGGLGSLSDQRLTLGSRMVPPSSSLSKPPGFQV